MPGQILATQNDPATDRDGQTRNECGALAKQHGTAGAARLLGMRRDTIVAIVSGLEVQPGTLALAREKLAALRTDSTATEPRRGPPRADTKKPQSLPENKGTKKNG